MHLRATNDVRPSGRIATAVIGPPSSSGGTKAPASHEFSLACIVLKTASLPPVTTSGRTEEIPSFKQKTYRFLSTHSILNVRESDYMCSSLSGRMGSSPRSGPEYRTNGTRSQDLNLSCSESVIWVSKSWRLSF